MGQPALQWLIPTNAHASSNAYNPHISVVTNCFDWTSPVSHAAKCQRPMKMQILFFLVISSALITLAQDYLVVLHPLFSRLFGSP